jgi:hypothetical protein
MNKDDVTFIYDMQAPRFAKLPFFLKRLSSLMGLKLEITTSTGWVFEDVFCKVTGDARKAAEFDRQLKSSIKDYMK